jgi:hypothetical protein
MGTDGEKRREAGREGGREGGRGRGQSMLRFLSCGTRQGKGRLCVVLKVARGEGM